MHMSLFIMCAMVTIEMYWLKERFFSLVIYGLPGVFDAIIGKLYIKLKVTSSSVSYCIQKVSRVRL